MRLDRKFRFRNKKLNDQLIAALAGANFYYTVDDRGRVYYHSQDTEAFEDVLSEVRASRFASWQVLSCPPEALDSYRLAMKSLGVRFAEEVNNDHTEFLIPGDVEPHAWELERATAKQKKPPKPAAPNRVKKRPKLIG